MNNVANFNHRFCTDYFLSLVITECSSSNASHYWYWYSLHWLGFSNTWYIILFLIGGMYITLGDCKIKLLTMKLLVVLVAVAVKPITLTVSGMMLRISFKCEYSVLNFSPLSEIHIGFAISVLIYFMNLPFFYAMCLIKHEAN